jgi:hypothetical protein
MNIPIAGILLVVVFGLIVYGYTTMEPGAEVPGITPSKDTNVIVLGVPSSELIQVLSSSEAMYQDIKYPMNVDPNTVTGNFLKNYQVVILQGDPYFDMNTREAAREYVEAGGKLIVVGDAGSKHPEYANVAGWGWPSGQGIPVPAQLIGEWSGTSDVATGSDLRIVDMTHPVVGGMKIMGSQLSKPGQVFKVTSNGNTIVSIDTNEGTLPALIEGEAIGTVYYFSYDPGLTPSLLLNCLK